MGRERKEGREIGRGWRWWGEREELGIRWGGKREENIVGVSREGKTGSGKKEEGLGEESGGLLEEN